MGITFLTFKQVLDGFSNKKVGLWTVMVSRNRIPNVIHRLAAIVCDTWMLPGVEWRTHGIPPTTFYLVHPREEDMIIKQFCCQNLVSVLEMDFQQTCEIDWCVLNQVMQDPHFVLLVCEEPGVWIEWSDLIMSIMFNQFDD